MSMVQELSRPADTAAGVPAHHRCRPLPHPRTATIAPRPLPLAAKAVTGPTGP
jgi:hypothetical protein